MCFREYIYIFFILFLWSPLILNGKVLSDDDDDGVDKDIIYLDELKK